MKRFSDISSKKYIRITENDVQEAVLTKFFRKKEPSKSAGGLLQAFRFSLSSVFDKAVLDGKKDDGIKLSEREKKQLAFAKELQQQTEEELKNELEHEEKLEQAYEELAHRQNMLKLKAEDARKQAERKRELNAVKQTIAKLKTREGMLKMMTGGPLTEDFVNQILTDADNIVKGVIPAEKELMADITTLVKASMYDKDGKFIGKDGLAKCVEKFSKENPELLKKIQNNKLYKDLSNNFQGENEKDFEAFIESNVERCTPTTEALKVYQDKLHSLQDTVKEHHKAIKDNESKIEELKKKRDEAPKKPDVPSFVQTILDKDDTDKLRKDDLHALGSGLIKELSIKATDKTLTDDKREDIRQKLVKLTGDSNIKIEKGDDETFTVKGGAEGNITKLEPKKGLSVDDVKAELKEYEQQVNDYQKSKEDHKKKVAECNEKIKKLEDQNKEIDSLIKDEIEVYNTKIKDGDKNDYKIDVDNYSDDLTKKVKEADKAVKSREKAITNTKLSIKKVHNTLGRLGNENKAEKYVKELKDDKEFQKKIEDIRQGKDKELFGEEDLYDEEKKVYRIPTGELDDEGNPEYKEIKKEDLEKGKNKEIVERAIYLRTAEIPDDKINELLDTPKPDDEDDEDAMKEWVKKVETGKAMKQAKLHARETLKDEYDISGEKLDEFINADEDFESDADDDEDDKKDFEGANKDERDERIKTVKNMSDEEKEKKAKQDKKDLENGLINPANVFKRGRNKITGKPNKTFRHIHNDKYRISKEKFREIKARYEEKKRADGKTKEDETKTKQGKPKNGEGEGGSEQDETLQIQTLRDYILESLR